MPGKNLRMLALILAAAFMACDVASRDRIDWEPTVYVCTGSRFAAAYSFDPRIERPLLWSGTSGHALEFDDLATGERVTLRNEDGWVCEPYREPVR